MKGGKDKKMTKQIRVYVDEKSYLELKKESQKFRLTLSQYAGIKLNGFQIVELKKQETK